MRRKLLFAILALPFVLSLGLVLYGKYGNHRGTIERLVTHALGRRLSIAGSFEADVGFTTRLVAEEITLANAPWSSEPSMVKVSHISGSIDLWSLIRGPVRIDDLRVDEARVVLETDAEGHANWEFGPDDVAGADSGGVVLGRGKLRDVTVSYRDVARETPLEIGVDELELRGNEDGLLDLDLSGRINGIPVEMKGRIGTLDNLLAGTDVEPRLTGHVGDSTFTLHGRIANLDGLASPDLELEMQGPDLAALMRTLGLPSYFPGPFRIDGHARPATEGVAVMLDLDLPELRATAQGTVSGLLDRRQMRLQLNASGPDLTAIGALAEIEGLPPKEFEISGTFLLDAGRMEIRQVRARVGENSASLDGVLGELPRMIGTEMTFEVEGTDLSTLSTLTGADLPAKSFHLTGHIIRREASIRLEDLQGRIGRATFQLSGEVGDWPRFAGTALDLQASCPDASVFGILVGFELPAAPIDFRGRLKPGEAGLVLEEVGALLGSDTLHLDGTIVRENGFVGTDVQVRLSGPDLSHVAVLARREHLPAAPFEIAGHVRVLENGYSLDAVEARVGDLDVRLDGHLDPLPGWVGTKLNVEARGPDLSRLNDYLEVDWLPAERFSVRGHVEIRPDVYELQNVVARLGAHDIEVEGTLVPADGLEGSDLAFEVSGPALADVGRLLTDAGLVEVGGLPADPYGASGSVRFAAAGYELRGITARVGEARLRVDGFLGDLPDGHGTDLAVEADGPDGTLVGAIAGIVLPAEPFAISGRVQRGTSGARFHDVRMHFGGYRVEIDGSLGEPPKLVGTRLDLRAEGPGLALMSQFIEIPVSDAPFTLSGHFDGTPEQFAVSGLDVRLGGSDVRGSLRVDLRDKPKLSGGLRSNRVDVPSLYGNPRLDEAPQTGSDSPEPGSRTQPEKTVVEQSQQLIPDDPLPLAWMRTLDADLHWDIRELVTLLMLFHDVGADLTLLDGRLEVGPLRGDGESGGSVFGSITLEPENDAYRLNTMLTAEQLRLALSSEAELREHRVPHDIQLELTGTGNSLHAMASTADGRIVVVQGKGDFDNSTIRRLTTDALSKIISTLNPFSNKDRYTGLECGVHVTRIDAGVAKLGPLVMVTDKMQIVGRGEIDLATEKLNLAWTAKPRKGVGLSASTFTNPYVKLGGTLTAPRVTVKPLQAAAATTAAVTTGGLSILAKGFWDRITSGTKACKKAKKKAGLE